MCYRERECREEGSEAERKGKGMKGNQGKDVEATKGENF